MSEASIAPGSTVENVLVPGGEEVAQVAMFSNGRMAMVAPSDVEAFKALGFSESSDETEPCPCCGTSMGKKDHSDGPGGRWGCGACGLVFCQKCYRPDGHICTPTPVDPNRFIDDTEA